MIGPHPWLGRYAGSFFAGLVVALYLVILVYGYGYNSLWLDQWQTLLSGGVAIIAAIGSIVAIYSQTESTENAHRLQHNRRVAAARAAIAAPLNLLVETQSSLLKEFGTYLTSIPVAPFFVKGLITSKVSQETLAALINAIENSDLPATEDIAELVAELQVQEARLNILRIAKGTGGSSGRLKSNIEAYALDCIFLYARCQRLFYYVRRQDLKYSATSFSAVLTESCKLEALNCDINEESIEKRLGRRDGDWLARLFNE